jgi:hypothetical protein
MEKGRDPECQLFRRIIEQGQAQGMPRGSWQGYYVLTPSGIQLDRINVGEGWRHAGSGAKEHFAGAREHVAIANLMHAALAKWNSLSRKERLQPVDPGRQSALVQRSERHYPQDGLVLHQYSRDLPRDPPQEDERRDTWNQDFVWFTKAEAQQFVPRQRRAGQKQPVPSQLVLRLARFHLVDNVRAMSSTFDERQIERAELTATLTEVKGKKVALRLEGQTRANRHDGGTGDERISPPRDRGVETRLLGKATYDTSLERFVSFELVAVGTRWGTEPTPSAVRATDLGPAPIGFLFKLAGDTSTERIAPLKFHLYEWKSGRQ